MTLDPDRGAAPPEDLAALNLIAALLTRGSEARLARELADNRQVVTAVHGLTFRTRGAALLEHPRPPADRGGHPGRHRRSAAARARPSWPGAEASWRAISQAGSARGCGRGGSVSPPPSRTTTITRPTRDLEAMNTAGAARGAHCAAGLDAGGPRSGRQLLLPPRPSRPGWKRNRQRRGGAERQTAWAPRWRGARAATSSGGRSFGGAHPRAARNGPHQIVTIEAAWAGGARRSALERRRRADRGARLLDAGTRTRAAPQIAAEVQALGGALAASPIAATSGCADSSAGDLVTGRRLSPTVCFARASRRARSTAAARRCDRPRARQRRSSRGRPGVCFARGALARQ